MPYFYSSFNGLLLKAFTVELSVLKGIIFCSCPNASNILLIQIAVLQLWKIADTSASAADETTCLSSRHSMWIGAFNFGDGFPDPPV